LLRAVTDGKALTYRTSWQPNRLEPGNNNHNKAITTEESPHTPETIYYYDNQSREEQ